MLNIEKKEEETGLMVVLSGRLDTMTSPELNTVMEEEIPNRDTITLDLKELEYLSSAGLRVLLMSQQALAGKGGLKVKSVPPQIMTVFQMTGFQNVLEIIE